MKDDMRLLEAKAKTVADESEADKSQNILFVRYIIFKLDSSPLLHLGLSIMQRKCYCIDVFLFYSVHADQMQLKKSSAMPSRLRIRTKSPLMMILTVMKMKPLKVGPLSFHYHINRFALHLLMCVWLIAEVDVEQQAIPNKVFGGLVKEDE